jgi:L-alanine-DL-glutamate epimerase-like enolase superfamily enzyme
MRSMNRRSFLSTLAAVPAASALSPFEALAAPEKGRVKIRDIKTMMIQGPRTYTLVKVETDSGLYGIGEGYGSPGVGVKEQILALKPDLVGKDPLEIDAIYTGLGTRTDGSSHSLMRAVSGIEIALWDLAGKIVGLPVTTLLGGKFRDSVRMYYDSGPRDMFDRDSCREWADIVKSDPGGWTAFKIHFTGGLGLKNPDPARDASTVVNSDARAANRLMTSEEIGRMRTAFENVREALGWKHDIMVHCAWNFDLRTAIQLAEAVEPIKPLWLEDPMPPDYNDGWKRLVLSSKVPICTGENLTRRQGFKDFIINQGCDIIHLDIRNTGGLLESKKIADLADIFNLPLANHNSGAAVCTMATIQWAAAIRDYLAAEAWHIARRDWMDDVIVHDGPLVKNGHFALPNKPGLGLELNREVVEAHLVPGEKWWG